MALHPQCKSFLDLLAAGGGKPMEQLPVPEARAMAHMIDELGGPVQEVAQIENRRIPGPVGAIPLRIYRPALGTLPALVFFHGGGFVICDLETHDRQCRALANAAGCAVIAVDYRLAPEHKFPAAPEDAYAATRHVYEHAAELGIDPDRLAVGGDSAGANLATVVALTARDRGGPPLRFQLLIYPVVQAEDDSASMREFGSSHFLTRELMDYFFEMYLTSPAERRLPQVSPIYAEVRGLPPAMVMTAECDPLRDQGEAYGRKLQAAGVAVELKRYAGMIHPFVSLAGIIDEGRTAIADAGMALRQALNSTTAANV
jgi:acetyl esterase